ncbi:SgcJ/EcaC family oxidoreductase [Mycobacterium sp. E2497]|uniref:SgcJ/EcaC family oxidoreductase n=1 Tax=Mycobacterium sp. E2497 TaxID=1834135 RepID=UPI001E322781|nr:SgcJ/EcaC family oxidoreductase [Mycobacterium sp. E2497]
MDNIDEPRLSGGDRAADEAAIRALLDRQISSWNAGDPVGYASAYTLGGDCVSFLGGHHRGREAIAASSEVPRAGSLFRRLLRCARLHVELTGLRFITPDVAVVHAMCSVTTGSRPTRRNRRTNTSVAVRTADGWLLAATQNTTQRPFTETLIRRLVS